MPIASISKEDIDLEDGEIEDDEEEAVKMPTPTDEKTVSPPKKSSPPKLEPPIIEASAVVSAKLLVTKTKEPKIKESKTKESKKHSKKHSTKSGKTNHKSYDAPKRKHAEAVEDDWADNVEKAIKAAMGGDRKAALPAKPTHSYAHVHAHSREEVAHSMGPEFGVDEDIPTEMSSEEKRLRKKKRKKRHREEEGDERKESKRRKKHHHKGEGMEENMEGEDDDEMLFVRGASPIWRNERERRASRSPANYHDEPYLYQDEITGQFEELYDSFEDDSEMEDYHHEMDDTSRRGRGGMRRRGRGGMRGTNRKPLRPRDLALLKKRKRMMGQRHPDQRPDSVCMFFMQGKCQKGDDCPYSHDALPPRKMELCKFYLMDCCAKKDKCLYMHHDFPCKFHHTGLKCYAGDRCKFSHGPLSDVLKNILLRHLETAPKEILGDFPRLSREGAAAMVHNKKNRDYSAAPSGGGSVAATSKSIPSLFDIEVPVPAQFVDENEEEGRSPSRKTTPMPSDEEDQDIENESSPAPKEPQSPSKRHKNRWDNGDETNKKPSRHELSRHEENKYHWDEEIRKQQEHSHEADEDERWDMESKQRDDGERKKRRNDKERKPRWDDPKEGRESHGRRRDGLREEEKKKWESEDRRNKKRYNREKSAMYGDGDNFGEDDDPRQSNMSYKEQIDQLKPMMRCYKESMEETTQSQRLLRLAGYSGVPNVKHADHPPRPLDLDTDAEDKDDLVMDFEEMESTRKESVDEAALVIDTQEEEYVRERDDGGKDAETSGNTFGDGRGSPIIPLHIQKLPKKQQELFLRIQQQQREQQANEGASAHEEKEEDRPEESWYSSDDEETEETSLTAVLKKLSSAKVPQQPDPELAQKVNDLTKVPDVSDAVNKLLSSIGMRTQPDGQRSSGVKTGTTLPVLPLPPLPLPQPAAAPRDPRLSRDPRKRQESSDTRTSQDSPTPGSSSSSSSRADPRSRRRSSGARSIYDTISLSGPEKPPTSIQGDTDLRGLLPSPRDVDLRQRGDTDLRTGYGDLDLRVGNDSRGLGGMMSPLTSSLLTARSDAERGGDVDLRRMLVSGLPFKPAPQHAAATEIDGSLNSHPTIPWRLAVATIPTPDYSRLKLSSADQLVRADPRLRKLFKISSSSPASPPAPAPALVSPTPSGGTPNPTARVDPRRLASQARPTVPDVQEPNQADSVYQHHNTEATMMNMMQNQQGQYVRNDLMANPMLMHQQMVPTMDMQGGPQSMQAIDPRMFRNAPQGAGLLGDAPFYPNASHYEEPERDNSNGSDTDLRTYYQGNKRGGNAMEMQDWEHQQMTEQHHPSYRNNNRNSWRGNSQRRNVNRQYEKRNQRNNRSYTPPM